MSLFSQNKTTQQGQTQQPTPEQLRDIRGIKADPAGFIRNTYGLNASGDDPLQIMDSLASSGQLNGAQMQRYNMARRMLNGRRG